MKASEIQEAVKKVMGEDPVEMVVRYYEGLIQISADRVAEELRKDNMNDLCEACGGYNNSIYAPCICGEGGS